MSKLGEFLQEANGQFSLMRLIVLLAFLLFGLDWLVHIFKGLPFEPNLELLGFILGPLGFKVIQKFAEQKPEQPK